MNVPITKLNGTSEIGREIASRGIKMRLAPPPEILLKLKAAIAVMKIRVETIILVQLYYFNLSEIFLSSPEVFPIQGFAMR